MGTYKLLSLIFHFVWDLFYNKKSKYFSNERSLISFFWQSKHDKRGVLSYANKGPNTNKSQFFITYAPNTQLDLNNTIFGHLIDGFETLDLFEVQPVNEETHKPIETIFIDDVTIHANPFAE